MEVNSTLLGWGIGLLIIVPVLAVIMSELIVRLERRESVYTRFWRLLRDVVLPVSVAFIIVGQILSIDATRSEYRLLETATWVVVAITLGSLLNAVGKAGGDKARWEAMIPGLFRGMLRVTIIGVTAYFVFSQIWGVQLNDLFTALGVGSLVIALALQDTLSSIVSGFLLTLDRPFDIGDNIYIDGRIGKVLDLNWRSVRLEVSNRDVIVIPNSHLANASIYNYSTRTESYMDLITINFPYEDPPNKVKQVLKEAAQSSSYLMQDPAPIIFLDGFEASSIRYLVVIWVPKFISSGYKSVVLSDVRTRLYYAAQRAGLHIPHPTITRGRQRDEHAGQETIRHRVYERLSHHQTFADLSPSALDYLANHATLQTYGGHEVILRAGEPSDGLYVLISGQAELLSEGKTEGHGIPLVEGSIFGEMVFLGTRPNPATVLSHSDVTVILIPPDVINTVLQQHPRFALGLDRLVTERQVLLHDHVHA